MLRQPRANPLKPTLLIRVALIVDWRGPMRAEFWSTALNELQPHAQSIHVKSYPLADKLLTALDAADAAPAYFLSECDVLVINWDALNGDPEFGSDFAQRWFEARQPELLLWLEAGGILIVEGQARMNIPDQHAYDSLVAPDELRVSRQVNPLYPSEQERCMGERGRVTRHARKSGLFRNLENITTNQTHTRTEMFPGYAVNAVTPALPVKWAYLYRGWFWWNPLRRTRLRWVPVIRTSDRRFNHPIMLVARHEKGAIYVTTMFLASAGQQDLIRALIDTHGNVDKLPARRKTYSIFQNELTRLCVPVVAAIAGTLIARTSSSELHKSVWTIVVILGGVVGFLVVTNMHRMVSWVSREIVGK